MIGGLSEEIFLGKRRNVSKFGFWMRQKTFFISILFSTIFCTSSTPALSRSFEFSGEAAAFVQGAFHPKTAGVGFRFLPAADLAKQISSVWSFRGNLTFYVAANGEGTRGQSWQQNASVQIYRGYLEASTNWLQIRLGTQNISFGAARLFRPEMWFDRVDPRDPLRLSTGVNSALLRYYFPNNASLWVWLVQGSGKTKGLEFFASKKNTPEFGGRLEWPFLKGNWGFSVHKRRIAANKLPLPGDFKLNSEERLGLDVTWDIGVGLWLEWAISHYGPKPPWEWKQMGTIGTDYTFSIGNGLYLLEETFLLRADRALLGETNRIFEGVMATYPLNLLFQVSAISVYDWKSGLFFHYVSLQKTTDHYRLVGAVFDFPETDSFWPGNLSAALQGKGAQIMFIWNF